MIWALIAVAIMALVILAVRSGRRSETKLSARTQERVEAYKQTIRRTGTPSQYDEMNDVELSDILTSAAQKLSAARNQRTSTMLGAATITLIAAIFVGIENGVQAFGITIVAGLIAGYGLNLVLTRHTSDWFRQNDLDEERLTID